MKKPQKIPEEPNFPSGGNFSVAGAMDGYSGVLTLAGAGALRFYGSAGSGLATFNLGTNSGLLYTRDGGTVNLGAVAGGANTTLRGAASSAVATVYVVGGNDVSTLFAGTISNATKGSATTAIVKVGAGTWTLTGTNIYSGGTAVAGGTVLVNNAGGSGRGLGGIIVSNGATLGGTGFITGPVTVTDGVLAPGSGGAGVLSLAGGLSMSDSATVWFECGSNSDRVDVTGDLRLGGVLNVAGLTGFGAGAYTLFTYSGALTLGAVALGPMPSGFVGAISTNTAGQVRLAVTRIAQPCFVGAFAQGTNLVLRGSNGAATLSYSVLSWTNLDLPLAQWPALGSNKFQSDGAFWITNPIDATAPQRYFLIRIP